jgi:hypothetical protein
MCIGLLACNLFPRSTALRRTDMTSALRIGSLTVFLLAATAGFAQTPQDPETHHPAGEAGTPPSGAAPEVAPGQMSGQSSGIGQGMMGPNTMGGGMMRQNTMGGGMMGGMGSGIMMDGRHMMMMMMNMMGMVGMMSARPGAEHIEGRLAFIKTELKITDAQMPQWNAFADGVRENAKSMSEMHQSMGAQQNMPKTLPERLAFEDKALTAHLGALKKTEGPLDKLYAALSPEQKKIADQIIVGPMGLPMGMM